MNRPALDRVLSRSRAAFLGLAIGDALGATTEFMTPAEIRTTYQIHNRIVGGGWLGVKAGQVTDDTEMSLALARAVVDGGGWNLQQIADYFVAWMRSKPIDIGATVRKGIRTYMHKGTLEMPFNAWDAGNGAAMRMCPVALASYGSDELLKRYTLEQAHLTHHHALSDAGCLCIGHMLHTAMAGGDRFSLHELTRQLVKQHPNFRFNNYNGQASGYIVDTLRTVFHFLFTTAGFEECLVGVVNQGGDADTTGAIAGMIAGALYGEESLPRHWLKKLDHRVRSDIERLTPQLLTLAPAFDLTG
ncbi:MAG: ADP-ribosyl-[dinitrogen reductase] hydrolase [Pelovirga sp.]